MSGADHLFTIILLASGVLGCVRGFIRETIALLTWLVGIWLAWRYAHLLDPWLGGALAAPGVREWVGRAAILLLVLLLGAAIGSITAYYTRRAAGFTVIDRVLGALFGLMRGAVVIGLLVIGGQAVDLDLEPWWEKTRSMPVAEAIASWLEHYAQPAAAELYDKALQGNGN